MRIVTSGRIWKILDPGLLLVIALSFVAAKPLLAGTGAYRGQDTGHHLYRMASMRHGWSPGELMPSLAEAAYMGNQSPSFRDYGGMTYYLTSALQIVINLDSIQALRWLLLLCCLVCGAGMYLFCQRRVGRLGALIGGLVYVNSPYLFHANAYLRGAYPELFALSLFPILLWRMDALRDAPNARNFILVLLLEAALINTHCLSAALLTAIAFAWLAFEAVVQSLNREASQLDGRGELWAALALSIGLLTAASVWLPALLEGESVSREAFLHEAESDHWMSIGELFKVAAQFYSIERPSLREALHIGIAQWTFAAAGVSGALALYVRGYRTRHPQAFLGAVFFLGLSLSLILMLTSHSRHVWASVSALRYLQFPWRLLGPVAVCMAYMAGLNGFLLSRLPRYLRLPAIALAIAVPVVCGFALTRAIVWNDKAVEVSVVDLTTSRHAGATRRADFFPTRASRSEDESRQPDNSTASLPIDKYDHRLPTDLSQATSASELGALISALALVSGLALAWRLQRLRVTPRPYAVAPSFTKGERRGL